MTIDLLLSRNEAYAQIIETFMPRISLPSPQLSNFHILSQEMKKKNL